MDEEDHRARGLLHDLVDQGEGVLRALAEADQRDIGSLPGGHGSDVRDVDLAGDHLVPELRDHRRDERQPILALVGDQHPEMLGLAIAHRRASLSSLARQRAPRVACVQGVWWLRFASNLGERASPAPTLGRCMGVPTSNGLRHNHQR